MRPIRLARMDKVRPVVVMTREGLADRLAKVTVAPITSRIRGLSTEVPVGVANGIEMSSAISCDNLTTIPRADLGRHLGYLLPHQEPQLARAIAAAFDLDVEW